MLITRTSMLSGEANTLDLPVTPEQLAAYAAGGFPQEVFRHLPPPLREFIMTGITPEEWEARFALPDPDEDEPLD